MTRRTSFAYDISTRRVADYNNRAATFRVLVLVGVAITLGLGDGALWAWAVWVIACLGAYQGFAISRSVLRSTVPREPLARWAYASATGGLGRQSVNVSGVFEGVSAILLGLVSVWGVDQSSARLCLLILALAWAASVFSAVFVDPAFYNPAVTPAPALELTRLLAGPVLTLAVLGLGYVRPWPEPLQWMPAVVAASGLLLTLRIRETDRALHDAGLQGDVREEQGRDLVLSHVHSMLTGPADVSLILAREHRNMAPELYEQARIIRSRMQELTGLEDVQVTDTTLPGSLARPVAGVAAPYGTTTSTTIDVDRLSGRDHDLARILIGDLVSNAAKAGALVVRLRLRREDGYLEMTVTDDIGDFPHHAWRRPGSSLERLGRILEARGGELALESTSEGSTIRARWLEIAEDPAQEAE